MQAGSHIYQAQNIVASRQPHQPIRGQARGLVTNHRPPMLPNVMQRPAINTDPLPVSMIGTHEIFTHDKNFWQKVAKKCRVLHL